MTDTTYTSTASMKELHDLMRNLKLMGTAGLYTLDLRTPHMNKTRVIYKPDAHQQGRTLCTALQQAGHIVTHYEPTNPKQNEPHAPNKRQTQSTHPN